MGVERFGFDQGAIERTDPWDPSPLYHQGTV